MRLKLNIRIVKLPVLLLLLVLLSCKKQKLGANLQSSHYVYYMDAGDNVDTAWQEKYYNWLIPQLSINNSQKLEYHKYKDRGHLKKVTGKISNGFAEPGTLRFHTIWNRDNHEGVHVLVIKHIGHPPALFTEGIAVAYHTDPAANILIPRWNQVHVDTIAKKAKLNGTIPALEQLIESTSFHSLDDNLTYPLSGSFVYFLINTYGLSKLKTFFGSVSFSANSTDTKAKFQNAYGMSLETAWLQWQAYLN